jgi:hypothetical protein
MAGDPYTGSFIVMPILSWHDELVVECPEV